MTAQPPQVADNKSTTLKSMRRSLLLISAPMVFINFALPLRAEDIGASTLEIGALYSLFTAAVFVVRPLTGIALDLVGRRPFFIAATLFYAAANILYALSADINGLFLARMLQGLGFAVLAITTDTITADLAQANARSANMGRNIASQTRGGMIGATIGFGLVGAMPLYAWVYSFWIFFAISTLAVMFAVATVRETRPPDHTRQRQTKAAAAARDHGLLAVIFIAAFASAIIQPYYMIYLRARFALELYMLALAFLPLGIAHALLPGLLGRFSDRFRRTSAVAAGLILAAGFYVFVPAISTFYGVIGLFIAASIGSVFADITKNAWVADLTGAGNRGRTFGRAALAAGGGAVLGPLAGGVIFDRLGAEYLFFAAAATLAAAAALSVSLQAKTGNPENA